MNWKQSPILASLSLVAHGVQRIFDMQEEGTTKFSRKLLDSSTSVMVPKEICISPRSRQGANVLVPLPAIQMLILESLLNSEAGRSKGRKVPYQVQGPHSLFMMSSILKFSHQVQQPASTEQHPSKRNTSYYEIFASEEGSTKWDTAKNSKVCASEEGSAKRDASVQSGKRQNRATHVPFAVI